MNDPRTPKIRQPLGNQGAGRCQASRAALSGAPALLRQVTDA
jgi:hypothetical protein